MERASAAVMAVAAAGAEGSLDSTTVGDDDGVVVVVGVAEPAAVAATVGASAIGDVLGVDGQVCGLSLSDAAAVAG